ncbi:biopolymer transporter ExbD [Paramagnetospirillum kuznetsovii]|uniref:Biopolymer transporter ExbD n=1 Tax=Paramagnetospirillum kuznetsovii TaxID=2053833 RepID=A0A364NZA0_9PROT|nr:biopolymer transporter ExbD [Paramagnetospirillum kuznetsovii]RAU22402.1 biopolymer transporter ExbD [Paramagnetospirillum kuznetsovii]
MSINLGSGKDEPEVMIDINTTPLIDVMLVLLIMLIITIPIQTHAVKLNLPNGPPPVADQLPMVMRIDVNADGVIQWNGAALAGREDLEARLREVAAMADQPELHLRPHKDAAYRHVAMVLAEAQHLGLTKIGIIGAEQFAE